MRPKPICGRAISYHQDCARARAANLTILRYLALSAGLGFWLVGISDKSVFLSKNGLQFGSGLI